MCFVLLGLADIFFFLFFFLPNCPQVVKDIIHKVLVWACSASHFYRFICHTIQLSWQLREITSDLKEFVHVSQAGHLLLSVYTAVWIIDEWGSIYRIWIWWGQQQQHSLSWGKEKVLHLNNGAKISPLQESFVLRAVRDALNVFACVFMNVSEDVIDSGKN